MTNKHEELNDSQADDLVGQVERLTAQVETLAQALTLQKRSRTRAYRWVAIAGSLVAVATVAGVATSQEADCDPSLPFCFSSGEPARATEVNQNFSALAEGLSDLDAALASKVDQDENGNVNITGQLGIRISRKNCSAELAASDPEANYTDCPCAAGEMALSGGGWAEDGQALRENRQHTSDPNMWRIGCIDLETQEQVVCGAMYVVCAAVANVD